MSFDLYGPATQKDITVGYIDPERGYITNVSIYEANRYAALNPGSIFILETRDGIKYLNINQVNKLTPNDILPKETATTASCRGIKGLIPGESALKPPRIVISGGSGLGAVANPIIGRDGSILAIDLERGGFGYKSPPQVRVIDESLQGSGAVLRAFVGELPPTLEVFDQEEDFEVYDLSSRGEDPANYGTRTDPDGKPIGLWDPNLFATLAKDPIKSEIQKYQDFLQKEAKPWWTTRKEIPLSVTFRDKTNRVKEDVTHPAWSKNFMNKYAISPVPPSNAKGTDYAGRVCTFEWEENFPYSGKYVFRGMADNIAKIYLDNDLLFETSNFRDGPKDVLNKNIKAGVHRIKIDLINTPIKEKSKSKPNSDGCPTEIDFRITTAANFANGIRIPGLNIDVSKAYKGNQLNESFQRKVELGREYDVITTSNKSDNIRLRTAGANVLQMEESTDDDWQDLVCTVSCGRFIKINGNKCKLIFDAPPAPASRQGSNQSQKSDTIFNTVDYIKKADRKLWRTNVYGNGGFLGEYGVCPFNTLKSLDGNPYAGTHIIRWEHIDFPVDGNYKIDIDVDDKVKLFIGNNSKDGAKGIGNGLRSVDKGGDEVIIEKDGFIPNTNKGTGKSTYTRFFKKGKYRIRADLFQKSGGRFSFDAGTGAPKASISDVKFVRRGNENYMKVDGSGSVEIAFRLKTDDNPTNSGSFASKIKIGKGTNDSIELKRTRDGRRGLKEKEVITGSAFFEAGREYLVQTFGSNSGTGSIIQNSGRTIGYDDNIGNGYDMNGELTITKVKGVQSAPVKGINPMALAINITLDQQEVEVISPRSWNNNPMGVALTIDAPEPPIPQEPIPIGEGRCPKNPIWTTRFPGSSESWYPVTIDQRWSKFMNRFALSPLAPLSTPNSDGGGGVTYTNSWNFEAPYQGFYAIKGAVDNGGRILVDGNEIIGGGINRPSNGLSGFNNPSPQFKKFFLLEGNHTVTVEVENQNTSKFKTINKKLFSTKDWIKPLTEGPSTSAELLVEYRGLNQGITNTVSGEKRYPIKVADRGSLGRGENAAVKSVSDKTIKFTDSTSQNDTDAEFKILSTSPGVTAKFSGSNDGNLELIVKGKGDITLRLEWNDDPNRNGQAVGNIKVADEVWKQTSKKGDVEKTINVGAKDTKEVIGKGGYIISGNSIKMKDGDGDDINSTFSIVSSTVDAKFSSDGKRIEYKGSGEITLKLNWDDNPNTAGKAVDSIAVGGKVWNQKGKKGSDTQTIRVTGDSTVRGGVVSGTAIDGVTYEGPLLFNHKHKSWSEFMNKNNVSPLLTPLDSKNSEILGTKTYTWSNVELPGGQLTIKFQSDDVGKLFIGKEEVALSRSDFRGTPIPSYVNISKGKYEIRVEVNNALNGEIFNNNPTGFALLIEQATQIKTGSKSWTVNPVGISAIIVPPPCPKIVKGRGVVTEIIAEEPGNGFPTPITGTPGYPVTLQLTEIVPVAGGINYTPGEPVFVNDIPIVPVLGNFGQVVSVPVPPLIGFTEYPDISLPSDTGIGFRGRPVFTPIRLPVDVLPDEDILQVTDLVGLKQTGYVNGKPYYGSVFSKDGKLFAGVYETIGELIPVYATLQESIDNQIITRPSAILRQGTDITSNDPRLNLPGTPDNLI